MPPLLHELDRAARTLTLEARGHWHGWRLDRHRALTSRHEAALAACLESARRLLAARSS